MRFSWLRVSSRCNRVTYCDVLCPILYFDCFFIFINRRTSANYLVTAFKAYINTYSFISLIKIFQNSSIAYWLYQLMDCALLQAQRRFTKRVTCTRGRLCDDSLSLGENKLQTNVVTICDNFCRGYSW